MNLFNVLIVESSMIGGLERLLEEFGIGRHRWSKSRVIFYQGVGYVSYTIICELTTFETIKRTLEVE